MAEVRHQRKEGPAVSDRMRYVPKPIPVRSEKLVTSVKASNGSLFNGDGSTQVIFDIPAMSGGYYLDSAATRFSFNVQLQNIGVYQRQFWMRAGTCSWTEVLNPSLTDFNCTMRVDIYWKIFRTITYCMGW